MNAASVAGRNISQGSDYINIPVWPVRGADLNQWVNTFSEVLSVVVVNLTQAPISFHQVVLGATQVDLTVLHNMTHTHKQSIVLRSRCIQEAILLHAGIKTPKQKLYLLTVLQLLHPEPSSLEAAAVGQVWETNMTEFSLQQQQTSNRPLHAELHQLETPYKINKIYRSRRWLHVLLCSRSGSWLRSALTRPCPEWKSETWR